MKAPRILLSGSDGSRINYENAIRRAGGIPCSFYCPPVSTDYDGLLLCGGEDVDPSYFHQENRGSRDMDLRRDQAEFPLVAAWLAAEKPIFGICRGHQVLNIALGGTLVQDIGPEPALFHTHDSHCRLLAEEVGVEPTRREHRPAAFRERSLHHLGTPPSYLQHLPSR